MNTNINKLCSLLLLVADPRVARDYFLRWSHYYYYFVIWTNLMKSNAFHNHIYHKIIYYYCRIVLFKIWNLNSTIVGWLIFTSLSQLNTFCMLHVNHLFHKGWNNVGNIFFLWKLKRIKFTLSWCFLKIKFGDSLPIIVKIPSNNSEGNTCYMFMLWLCNCMIGLGCNL